MVEMLVKAKMSMHQTGSVLVYTKSQYQKPPKKRNLQMLRPTTLIPNKTSKKDLTLFQLKVVTLEKVKELNIQAGPKSLQHQYLPKRKNLATRKLTILTLNKMSKKDLISSQPKVETLERDRVLSIQRGPKSLLLPEMVVSLLPKTPKRKRKRLQKSLRSRVIQQFRQLLTEMEARDKTSMLQTG
jgi:hypothetical protein